MNDSSSNSINLSLLMVYTGEPEGSGEGNYPKVKCQERGLNTRPSELQSAALPAELSRQRKLIL
jgi:hypothetical protein